MDGGLRGIGAFVAARGNWIFQRAGALDVNDRGHTVYALAAFNGVVC